jgi:hypothetical protein
MRAGECWIAPEPSFAANTKKFGLPAVADAIETLELALLARTVIALLVDLETPTGPITLLVAKFIADEDACRALVKYWLALPAPTLSVL